MNFSEDILALVKGEDKTFSIQSCYFDKYRPIIYIVYKSSAKKYIYSKFDVKILKNPENIDISNDCLVVKDELPLHDVHKVQFFGQYCRIFYKNRHRELIGSNRVRVVKSVLRAKDSKDCFNYLKEIAAYTGIISDGHNILAERYNRIDFVREDSVLAAFLSGRYVAKQEKDEKLILYPFGFNLSQKKAVENALNNRISIIEGPPGTGKTQTILNIIANVVMRGESIAVISNNNTATENVFQKLKKSGVSFIAAPLGNIANKAAFLTSQQTTLPDMSEWTDCGSGLVSLRYEAEVLDGKLKFQNELSVILSEEDAIKKEYVHFNASSKNIAFTGWLPDFSKRIDSKKILRFMAEYEVLISSQGRIGLFRKLRLKISYRLKNLRFFSRPIEIIEQYCQKLYYDCRLQEIERRKLELQEKLAAFDFDIKMLQYTAMSMATFKASLAKKYENVYERKYYNADDLWRNSKEFVADYPVILSTAYSLRTSLSNDFVYDYVVVDEASQVDLATGALALSCAKKAVIVGDLKQLPNVVDGGRRRLTDSIFSKYKLAEAYRYSNHSLLSSFTELFTEAPHVLLREHYRCHPDIIGFCNQRFYNNELIILTKRDYKSQPMKVYRTAPGNHARGHVNQRQIDVITDEVFPDEKLDLSDGSVGIVTPYRSQAEELKKVFAHTSVKADTVDRFQGQEKHVIIFSTVDNEIGEFVSDPNRLNVAVSRAMDQFIVVTDGNDNDKRSPIHELIGYIQYNNFDVVDSHIHSVFDYLYHNYADVRKDVLKQYGKVSEVDSENLMYKVIRKVLCQNEFIKYDVILHVPLRLILSDFSKLNMREYSFVCNRLTHVDFLIFSKLTHQPVLVVEVDGFGYHNNDKQRERDRLKDSILQKYRVPILRLSTVGSQEEEKLIAVLNGI